VSHPISLVDVRSGRIDRNEFQELLKNSTIAH